MQQLLRNLENSQELTLANNEIDNLGGADDADDEDEDENLDREVRVFTVEIQAHQLISDSDGDIGLVIDGVSVQSNKKKNEDDHRR